jgi:hypothetical protein
VTAITDCSRKNQSSIKTTVASEYSFRGKRVGLSPTINWGTQNNIWGTKKNIGTKNNIGGT